MELKHQWTAAHCQFVRTLLDALQTSGVRYFILRNYEELPENNNGKDVDIVIEPGSYATVHSLVQGVMRSCGIRYYQITQYEKMRCWYIMDWQSGFGLHIDIIENEVCKGYTFFPFDELYTHTQQYKGFTVLGPAMDTVMLLVQNLVAYKWLKPKYRATVAHNYAQHKPAIDALLHDFWGQKAATSLITNLERGDFDAIVQSVPMLVREARRHIFAKRPLNTLRGIAAFLAGRFYRVVWCPRKFWRFIAVEAPDGTGKTTFIDNLVLAMRKHYVSDAGRFNVHHFRPQLLPNLGAAGEKAGVMKQDTDFTNPHRAKPANPVSSLIRMCYYWIDYVVGVPYLLRKEVHYEQYTIFDRYIYDFLVDPGRSRIQLPRWVRLCFAKLVIKPQILFVLDADTDVIYKRKQELTPEEITRQLAEFRRLADVCPNVVFIDANRTPQEMVTQATEVIMNKFLHTV